MNKILMIDFAGDLAELLKNLSEKEVHQRFGSAFHVLTSTKWQTSYTPFTPKQHIHILDLEKIKKIKSLPLLGHEGATRYFLNTISDLRAIKWDEVVSISQNGLGSNIATLFESSEDKSASNHLISRLAQLGFNDSFFFHCLWISQNNPKDLEKKVKPRIEQIFQLKEKTIEGDFKKIIISYDDLSLNSKNASYQEFLSSVFTLTDKSQINESLADLTIRDKVSNTSVPKINLNKIISNNDLLEKIAENLFLSIQKWFVYQIYFEGKNCHSLAKVCEKILLSYSKEAIKDFLYREVNDLKTVSRVILKGNKLLNKNQKFDELNDEFMKRLSFSMRYLICSHLNPAKTSWDVDSLKDLKSSLRYYNYSLERLFKKIFLEPVKTDLALTL